MATRKRPVIAWVRILHRWISIAFLVIVVVVLVQTAAGGQADPVSGAIALSLLTLLAISGAWTAVYHYAVKAKHARRKSSVGA
ncbi:MAG TPA: hypothetical protein PJ992_07435 [Arachnia sp.]|jgi:disulfide bond formation protein DsbB|nr:hypothetical protein [Arachnia sp.]